MIIRKNPVLFTLAVFFISLSMVIACGKNKGPDCKTDSDCEEGMICFDETCKPEDADFKCKDNDDCPPGYVCENRNCNAKSIGYGCSDEDPCPGNMVCADNLPGGYCTMSCETEDCPDGSVCVVLGGEPWCMASCERNFECRQGYQCNAGVCDIPCTEDAECLGGEICLEGRCQGSGVGRRCSSDADCRDLECTHTDFGGYCTVECSESDNQCPVGSVCGNLLGETNCLASCRIDDDCGDGRLCIRAGCIIPCTRDEDCKGDKFCDGGGICRSLDDSSLVFLDLGSASPGQNISFEVPEGAHSITLLAHGSPQSTYGFTSIIDPDGTERITGELDMGFGQGGLTAPHRTMPQTEIASTQIPNSDFDGMELIPGTWSFAFSGGNAEASVIIKQGGESGGTVPLNVFVAPSAFPGNINASNLADEQHFHGILDEWEHFYVEQAGISLGEIRFFDLPHQYTDIEIDIFSGDLEYEAMFRSFGRDDGLNAFFVRSISMGFMGSVAGISGGIPGPPKTGSTLHSGIVIEVQDQPRFTGLTFCHEAGHFQGLFHTSEQNLFGGPGIHDMLTDTPECTPGGSNPCTEAKRHLMWPMLEPTMDILSPASATVLRAHAGVD